jgi:hypothetical protein
VSSPAPRQRRVLNPPTKCCASDFSTAPEQSPSNVRAERRAVFAASNGGTLSRTSTFYLPFRTYPRARSSAWLEDAPNKPNLRVRLLRSNRSQQTQRLSAPRKINEGT